jgi:hypothetical protein
VLKEDDTTNGRRLDRLLPSEYGPLQGAPITIFRARLEISTAKLQKYELRDNARILAVASTPADSS